MILLAAIAVVAASVPLAGGSLSRLATVRLRWVPAVFAGMALQLPVVSTTVEPGPVPVAAHLGSYLLVGAFIAANRHLRGVPLIALGGGANAAAIAANGGVMPASPGAAAAAGLPTTTSFANSAVTTDADLWFLGDVFALPEPFPLANVFSVGDVALVIGLALFLHVASASRLARRRCSPPTQGDAPRRSPSAGSRLTPAVGRPPR